MHVFATIEQSLITLPPIEHIIHATFCLHILATIHVSGLYLPATLPAAILSQVFRHAFALRPSDPPLTP